MTANHDQVYRNVCTASGWRTCVRGSSRLTEMLWIRLSPELLAAIDKQGASQHIKRSEVVRRILEQTLDVEP